MIPYTFHVVVEPDGGTGHVYYCPALMRRGDATWGETHEEALSNIREAVERVIADLIEAGEHLPETVPTSQEPLIRCRPELAAHFLAFVLLALIVIILR